MLNLLTRIIAWGPGDVQKYCKKAGEGVAQRGRVPQEPGMAHLASRERRHTCFSQWEALPTQGIGSG